MPAIARKSKLIRISFLTTAFVAALILMLFYFSRNEADNAAEMEDFFKHLAVSCTSAAKDHMAYLEDISFQFIANRDLNQTLREYSTQEEKYQVSKAYIAFTNFLEGQAFTNPEMQNAIFWDYDEPAKKALTMREGISNDAMNYLKTSEFAAEMRAASGDAIWRRANLTNRPGDESLLLGRMVKHTFSDSPLGFLVIVIDPSSIVATVKKVVDMDLYYSIGILRSEYLGIFDSKSSVLIAKQKGSSQGDEDLQELFGSLSNKQIVNNQGSGPVWVDKEVGSDNLLFILADIGSTGWKLALPMALRSSTQFTARTSRQGAMNVAVGVTMAAMILLLAGLGLFWRWTPVMAGGRTKDAVKTTAPALDESSIETNENYYGECGNALARLTDKEMRLLCLIVKGYSNKKIADVLCVAEQTVKNSVSALYVKLGVEDRVQASVYAVRMGIEGYEEETNGDGMA